MVSLIRAEHHVVYASPNQPGGFKSVLVSRRDMELSVSSAEGGRWGFALRRNTRPNMVHDS